MAMDMNLQPEDEAPEEAEEEPQHVYFTMCKRDGDLRDVDLQGFIRNLIAIGQDYGIYLESITAQNEDFQIGSRDHAVFGKLWQAVTSKKEEEKKKKT